MSREIDYNDPDSWTDEDKVYLSQRMHLVPEEHREQLQTKHQPVLVTPGVSPQMEKLTNFVRDTYPDRMNEDPVDVVISELGGDPNIDEPDDYDSWKLAELKAEAGNREGLVAPIGDAAKQKGAWVESLREWDKQHPTV